jgi:hypothetical protein
MNPFQKPMMLHLREGASFVNSCTSIRTESEMFLTVHHLSMATDRPSIALDSEIHSCIHLHAELQHSVQQDPLHILELLHVADSPHLTVHLSSTAATLWPAACQSHHYPIFSRLAAICT